MTTAQKIIKYLAIAFAIFLIISIISTITAVVFALSGILGLKQNIEQSMSSEMIVAEIENNDIRTLDIEVDFTNLTIKTGESLKLETNNNNINYKQDNQKLEIKEKTKKSLFNYTEKELILYLPEQIEFEKVRIMTGAGKVDIENFNTEKLLFELGAGETKIHKLNVSKECEIDGGAGKITISNGVINNLDLDMGVGEVSLTSSLIGKNAINAGVGSVNIKLKGEKESYKIQVDKGIGSIKIDGEEISNSEIFGDGENYIEVNGGIGNIKIDLTV